WSAPSVKAAVERQLEAARKSHPDHPDVLFWSARYEQRWGRAEEARRLFNLVIRKQPERARNWLALAQLELSEIEHSAAPATAPKPSPTLERLMRLANSPDELNFVGSYFTKLDRPDQGLPFAVRAVEKAPGCWECQDTLAALLFQKGLVAQAIERQRWALNLVPEGSPDA